MSRIPALLVVLLVSLAGLAPLASPVVGAQEATPPGFLAASPAASVPAGVTVVANFLTNPRGFTWGSDGALYVAEAGVGGSNPGVIPGFGPDGLFGGKTASVVRLEQGCPVSVAEGLPSGAWAAVGWIWGAMDVAELNGTLYVLIGGGGSDFGNPDMPAGVYRVNPDGSVAVVADLSTWFRAHPPKFVAADYSGDGSLVGLVAGTDALWVSEAVGGRILRVTPDGSIALVADLSEGHLVPSGIALAPDGGVYVGYETAAPYPVGGAKISHVAADGTISDVWTGLTRVTDVAVGPDGSLYAVELDSGGATAAEADHPGTGRILHQTGPASAEPIVTDLDYPVYLNIDAAGKLYVDLPGVATGTGAGAGMLLRIDPATGPISAANLDLPAPTCSAWSGMSAAPAAATPAA